MQNDPYKNFTERLKLHISKYPSLMITTLSNIFTMRLIGNKTHGDLAEIAIAEFINQYMYDFKSVHVGKDLYRAKSKEEDVTVTDLVSKEEFPVSLKAYGDGPLQLSTDKSSKMFPCLETFGENIEGNNLKKVFEASAFSDFRGINVLPLIYNEKNKTCNILVFDYTSVENKTCRITLEKPSANGTKGRKRTHPVYRFYDENDGYICEVRYGDAKANALQRGLWTHTKNAFSYFDSITSGWISYSHNETLVKLFSHALVGSEKGHEASLTIMRKDIASVKRNLNLPQ